MPDLLAPQQQKRAAARLWRSSRFPRRSRHQMGRRRGRDRSGGDARCARVVRPRSLFADQDEGPRRTSRRCSSTSSSRGIFDGTGSTSRPDRQHPLRLIDTIGRYAKVSFRASPHVPIRRARAPTGGASLRIGRIPAYMFRHLLGNRSLTPLTNVLFNTTLSDMENQVPISYFGRGYVKPVRGLHAVRLKGR